MIDLVGFPGNVRIDGCTFSGSVASYSNCDVGSHLHAQTDDATTDEQKEKYQFMQDDITDVDEMQIRSIISITSHAHQVTIVDNTFSANTGTKGVVYLDLYDRLDHPLTVSGNQFTGNAGYADASALHIRVRAQSGQDVATEVPADETEMFCSNIAIDGNVFTNNHGCTFHVGAVVKF